MTAVRRDATMNRSYARCMVTGKDIISDARAGKRSVRDSKMIRSRLLEISRNNT